MNSVGLKNVDAHLDDILSTVSELEPLELTLLDAHGCVLAEDVVASAALPAFDNSSMDGYAVRAADVASATADGPVTLPVIGDIPAGTDSPLRVQPGLCVRIMTGAPLPPGADCVIPVESTDGGIASVRIDRPQSTGDYVRRAGEDVTVGETVLSVGSHLGAVQVGLLAAVNRASVLVRPRPRVVVLSTGSELVEAGTPLRPSQLVDSNSHALTAAASEAGGIAFRVGIVPDDPRHLLDTLEDHLIRADVIVTSGGVSVGAYDVVRDALSRLGTVEFSRVAMQPGMPQAFGTIGPDSVPFFGLPGNPVSALVSFEVFVRPALRRMLGAEPLHRPSVLATLASAWSSPRGKRQYVRVSVRFGRRGNVATPVGGPGSHLLSGFAAANGLAVVAEDVTDLAAGAQVPVVLLERRSR